MIVVIDYGLGNVRSVAGAIEKIGAQALISSEPADIRAATKLILPGVGAFGDGITKLGERGLIPLLNEMVLEKKMPILGICLGAQLMATEGLEFGSWKGLNWFNGTVKKLEVGTSGLKLPHVGWDVANQVKPSLLFSSAPPDALFYYTHSYHFDCTESDAVCTRCNYGENFVAGLERENIYATQFHPEKSQLHGLNLIKNFIEQA